MSDPQSNIELVRLPEPCTLRALEAALRRGVHVLCLVAHGHFFRETGESVLYLAKENNQVEIVKDSALSSMFARQLMDNAVSQDDKLRLVHLSSCQTAGLTNAETANSLPTIRLAKVIVIVSRRCILFSWL